MNNPEVKVEPAAPVMKTRGKESGVQEMKN